MNFDIPTGRRYLESHEWTTTDDTVRIGITDFAQDELGVIESIKAVSDLVSPVTGTVVGVNEALFDAPELVNEDPYGDGWMLEVDPSDSSAFDDLLSAEEYRGRID